MVFLKMPLLLMWCLDKFMWNQILPCLKANISMNKGPMGLYPKSWSSGGRKALNTAIMASNPTKPSATPFTHLFFNGERPQYQRFMVSGLCLMVSQDSSTPLGTWHFSIHGNSQAASCVLAFPHSSLVTQVTGTLGTFQSPTVHAPMALADSQVDAAKAPYSQSKLDWLWVFNNQITANTAVILW